MKTVGITGAAGNVGTTLQKGLRGSHILKLFDINGGSSPTGGEIVSVDTGERDQLAGLFSGLDVLIHLAGNPRPNAPKASTIRNNFVSTSYVFEEARAAGAKKIIFASSNFYHEGDIGNLLHARDKRRLITLDAPPTPQCLYGESKVFGETVGRHLSHLGVQFIALRIGWTVPEDNPQLYDGAYMRAVFCSHRDLVQAFSKAIDVETDFMTAFAVSNNSSAVFDLEATRNRLGFNPQDDADNFIIK
ncbi:MAG: NAD(P)-dependent oxidoreductase [Desulfuromonadaceae bacterium]|nr:NAD(P)-dependent oxidoreductase [Desulfuromonadaceae bacterium]MDD5107018.1 NAD(P)-dependent oxidoreductase [Desulfuromonadaceae bacterium]